MGLETVLVVAGAAFETVIEWYGEAAWVPTAGCFPWTIYTLVP